MTIVAIRTKRNTYFVVGEKAVAPGLELRTILSIAVGKRVDIYIVQCEGGMIEVVDVAEIYYTEDKE